MRNKFVAKLIIDRLTNFACVYPFAVLVKVNVFLSQKRTFFLQIFAELNRWVCILLTIDYFLMVVNAYYAASFSKTVFMTLLTDRPTPTFFGANSLWEIHFPYYCLVFKFFERRSSKQLLYLLFPGGRPLSISYRIFFLTVKNP